MKILIAVDGSECSDVAVEEVAKRPWPADSVERIISVAETLSLEELELPPRYREDIESAARHRAQTIAERAIARLRESDARFLPIISTVLVDSPKDAIIEEAERCGADLIVVGSHGYGGPNARCWVRSRRRSLRRRNVPSRSRGAGDRRAKM